MNINDQIKEIGKHFNNKKFKTIIRIASTKKNADNIDVLNLIALAYDQQAILEKDTDKQNKLWEESSAYALWIQKKFSNSSKGFVTMGTIYLHQGNIRDAIRLYKKAYKIDPKNTAIYINLGNGYRAIKNYSEAEKNYLKATKYRNLRSVAYINLVGLYKETGDIDKMNKSVRKTIVLLKGKRDQFSLNELRKMRNIVHKSSLNNNLHD